MSNLNELLCLNYIKKEEIENIVYKGIILNIFEKVYNYLETNNNRVKFVKKLRSCRYNEVEIQIYRNLVKKLTNFKVGKEEIELVKKFIKAYLQKSNFRISISNDQKNEILNKQNFKCNICKKDINLSNCHIDHIIPFKYVGDELDSNYQALCRACNLSKNSNLYAIFDKIIQLR